MVIVRLGKSLHRIWLCLWGAALPGQVIRYISIAPVLPYLVTLAPLREHPKASGAGLIMLWPIALRGRRADNRSRR
jgi:hypothetical protein